MLHEYEKMREAGKCEIKPLRSVRVKLLVACQWKCEFCHMEGNFDSGVIAPDLAFADCLKQFRDELGFNEVHYTGGEPTAHPKILKLIEIASDLNMAVKITSNGQISPEKMKTLITAGLKELTVSVHTLSAEELAAMQAPFESNEWGRRNLDRQLRCLETVMSEIPTKVNTVVADTFLPALAVYDFCRQRKIKWRVMNELNCGQVAYDCLFLLVRQLRAQTVKAFQTEGSSSCTLQFITAAGSEFTMKLIRPFRLRTMCDRCQVDARGECHEYVYGPRVEAQNRVIKVRSCLYRHNKPCVLPVNSFFKSNLCREIKGILNIDCCE